MKTLTSTFTVILTLMLSGCRAQDRTTEAGEAAIQGHLIIVYDYTRNTSRTDEPVRRS